MRNFLLTILFLAALRPVSSQNIIMSGTASRINVIPGQEANTALQIKNAGHKTIHLAVEPLDSEYPAELYTFCYKDACWSNPAHMEAILLAPGQQLTDLEVRFSAGYEPKDYQLHLNFYDLNNPADHLPHTLKFSVRNSFSNGIMFEEEGISVSDAYPNPTASLATIDYSILNADTHASIVVHNLLGNRIMELPLDNAQTNVKIPTDNFNNGVYFYSLYINEKRTITKKIIVKK